MAPEEYDVSGDWKEWSQYVKIGIKDLKTTASDLQKEVNNLKIELGMLKTKMAIWGALGATVATLILQLVFAYLKLRGGGAP